MPTWVQGSFPAWTNITTLSGNQSGTWRIVQVGPLDMINLRYTDTSSSSVYYKS